VANGRSSPIRAPVASSRSEPYDWIVVAHCRAANRERLTLVATSCSDNQAGVIDSTFGVLSKPKPAMFAREQRRPSDLPAPQVADDGDVLGYDSIGAKPRVQGSGDAAATRSSSASSPRQKKR